MLLISGIWHQNLRCSSTAGKKVENVDFFPKNQEGIFLSLELLKMYIKEWSNWKIPIFGSHVLLINRFYFFKYSEF